MNRMPQHGLTWRTVALGVGLLLYANLAGPVVTHWLVVVLMTTMLYAQ